MSDNAIRDGESRTFLAPPKVLVGDGSSAKIGDVLASMGAPPGVVAVVADEAVLRLGLARAAVASLERAGFEPRVAASTAAEPTLDDAAQCIDAVRASGAVAVVGIGGGSALDLAKFAALAAPREDGLDSYLGTRDDVRRTLTLAAIPTTAGTGSEATRIAMLSVAKQKRIVSSAALVPDLVVLDPLLVLSLPVTVAAATGLDALCHAIESLLSTARSRLSVADSQQGLRLVARWLRQSCSDPRDVEARRNVLYGAHFAGRGLNAGVVLGHSIGYTIANRTSIAHGISCAMALPYCLRYERSSGDGAVIEIAVQTLGVADADALVAWLFQLNRDLGVPRSLAAAGIVAPHAAEMAQECLERYPRPNNPTPLELGRLTALYEAMRDGDLATGAIV